MVYSKYILQRHKKIPHILFVFAAFSLISCICIYLYHIHFQNKKTTLSGITNVWITNLSKTGADIIWINDTKKKSKITWGEEENNLYQEIYPEIYEKNINSAHIPFTDSYKSIFFQIQSENGDQYDYFGKRIWKLDIPKNQINTSYLQAPAYGKVYLPSGKPYVNTIIIYEVEGFLPLSAVTKQTGEWIVPLNALIESKSGEVKSPGTNQSVTILLPGFLSGKTKTLVKQTRPLSKPIIAGVNQEYISKTASDESVLGVDTGKPNSEYQLTPSVIYPRENAIIPGNRPLIRGTGIPGETFLIFIMGNKKQYSYRTTVNEGGSWLIQQPVVMEPGSYSISFTSKDRSGFPITIRRAFIIAKGGEQVLGEATGSPTIIPTVIPTVTVYPSISLTQPTQSVISPTLQAIPSDIISPTTNIPTSQPPQTGGGMISFLFTAFICLIVGVMLIFVF